MNNQKRNEKIKKLYGRGLSQKSIGRKFGLFQTTISAIISGKFGVLKNVFCKQCKKSFQASNKKIFCSLVCAKKFHQPIPRWFECIFCGTKILSHYERTLCKEHQKLQGKDILREKVRMRDNRTCQKCFRVWREGERRFDVHHLDEEAEGWDNKTKNPNGNRTGIYQNDKKNFDRMTTLCHKCHLNLPHIRERMSEASRIHPILQVEKV